MAICIPSNDNRFYTELEASYGEVPAITAADRISAIQLGIRQRRDRPQRRDKTGTRTFTGVAAGGRKNTEFTLQTYFVENASPGSPPPVGPLVQSSLGGAPAVFAGGTAGSGSTASQIVFSANHGLVEGQAFGFAGELRFVSSVVNSTTVEVSAPFSSAPSSGDSLTAAVSYFPATDLPSVSVFDYWADGSAVDRILAGAVCDRMQVRVNGDFHELEFTGEAKDVLDSVTFSAGEGGLTSFPQEPAVSGDTGLPIPGNLGQAWFGSPASEFATVAAAVVEVDNDLDVRNREFGSSIPLCVTAGLRQVTANIELLGASDAPTQALYAAARNETPITVMFQLGETPGQLLGVHMKSVVAQLPEFDDEGRSLEWNFTDARAQGQGNDEIIVAFG